MDGYMPLDQLAKAANLSDSALRYAIRRGELRAERVAYRWFVSEEEARRFLAEPRKKAGWPLGQPRPRRQPPEAP